MGSSDPKKPPTDVERFLSMLRFDSRDKVNVLELIINPETDEISGSRLISNGKVQCSDKGIRF